MITGSNYSETNASIKIKLNKGNNQIKAAIKMKKGPQLK